MTKTEILHEIVEIIDSTHEKSTSVLNQAIKMSIQDKLNEKLDIKKIKPIIDSCAYIIEQIENLESQIVTMQMLNDDGFPFPYEEKDREAVYRQINKFMESLQKCINEL
jgi:hypothetical protein